MAVTDPNALWAQALADPSVAAGKSGLSKLLVNAYLNYGDTSSLFAKDPTTGRSLADDYAITPNLVSGAETNPYSTLHQLGDENTRQVHNATQGLAGRGLEFSGAAGAMAQANKNADQLRRYQAQQGLAGTISGIGQQYGGLLQGAYQTLMGNALNDPTIPATPDAPAAPAATVPTGPPVYGQPSAATVSAGGPTNTYNAQAPQNQLGTGLFKPVRLPKPKVAVAPGLHGGNQ